LKLDEDAGHAQALFVDWQFTAANEELLDPARYQYREFYILLDAIYGDKKVAFYPYIFVDNDSAMARGWAQGFPKRLATVFQTRTFASPSKASPRVAAGNRFAGSMSSNGQRLAEGRVLIEKPLDDPSSLVGRPTINLRHFPQLAACKHQTPAVHELVQAQFSNCSLEGCVGWAWRTRATGMPGRGTVRPGAAQVRSWFPCVDGFDSGWGDHSSDVMGCLLLFPFVEGAPSYSSSRRRPGPSGFGFRFSR
jgi:hypothetical protein